MTEFASVNNLKRPIRLTEATRVFAWDSLNHVWGLDTAKTPAIVLDDEPGFEALDDLGRYDLALRRIAEKAPLRICPGEKLSGAATLGDAIGHMIPAVYHGKNVFYSVSHLTVDFETVLKKGICGIRRDIEASREKYRDDPSKSRFLESCYSVTESFSVWRGRYLEALKGMPEYSANLRLLEKVPFEPASDFYEAVQSLWFTFAFLRLCGNWPGIGRIDWLLGDYLKKDLAEGKQTLESAREILAHFFIKGCEWIKGGDYGSGDAQHYQNILLAGCDENGRDITNEVTYLVLDVIEELGISDFPTSVRLGKNTDPKLLARCAEVLRYGGGVLAFYNEETVLKALLQYGYPGEEVWKFANDGCWEVQIPGRTYFSYIPFDALEVLQKKTLDGYSKERVFADYDSLYRAYIRDLREKVFEIFRNVYRSFEPSEDGRRLVWKKGTPCTAVSVFEGGCIEKGLSYFEGGPVYNVVSPHIGGFPDVVNSLYAIKKLVFEDRLVSFTELLEILSANWEGYEDLRRIAVNKYRYYGNDNDEADAIASDLLRDFAAICAEGEGTCGYRFPAGISTFGRQLEWAPNRLAAPHGHRAGDVLAPNCSPTPGSDREGATAIIRSYCKADLTGAVTGAALDVKLLPSSVEGEDGIGAIVSLLRGFVALGGFFMQPDVADSEILKQAQLHPEDYQTLSVRVSGWNARFVTLNKQWQDMIIDENK